MSGSEVDARLTAADYVEAIKHRTIRAGFAKILSQGITTVVRVVSLVAMARLLTPEDFGLFGMVSAAIGILGVFKDFGLSAATVQRSDISDAQLSALFWMNVAVGSVLSVAVAASGPWLAAFYGEPRLVPLTLALSVTFVIGALGVQHSALLERHMRFAQLSVIEVGALFASVLVGVLCALAGLGPWALVAMTLAGPVVTTVATTMSSGWLPSRPQWATGTASMLRAGGLITLNSVVVYVAYNLDKMLVARTWGATALGSYGRAYQLASIPAENLNSAIGSVAFSALSRVRDDPDRLRSYFLKGYALLVAITTPVTVACMVLAEEIVKGLLGPKWIASIEVFRLLCPTILAFGVINPLGAYLLALGLYRRSLMLALLLAPMVIAGYSIGLPYGPEGVAAGFSAGICAWTVPHLFLALRGTPVSAVEVLRTVLRPIVAASVGGAMALVTTRLLVPDLDPMLRLVVGLVAGGIGYGVVLLVVFGQWPLFAGVWASLRSGGKRGGDSGSSVDGGRL